MFELFGPCLETLLRNWQSCGSSMVRVSQQQRRKNQKHNSLFLSVTVWEPGTGGQDVKHGCGPGHTRQPTRETTESDAEMRCKWHFFGGVNAVWHHIPGAVRCTAPSRTSGVRMLRSWWQAPAPVTRLAWARRLRRLTPLPWPIRRGLRERALARSVSRTCARRGVQLVGLFNGLAEFGRRSVRAIDANRRAAPGFWPAGTARAALSADDWRRHALFTAKPSNEPSSAGAGKSGARLRLDAPL